MEGDRFDFIAKAVGRRTTRRFAFAAGTLLAGVSGLRWSVPRAEAAGASDCKGVNNKEIISKNNCGKTACGGRDGCVCVQTPGHHVRCAAGFNEPDDCRRKDECSGPHPCPRGQFCAKVLGCCGRLARKVCLRPCPA